MSWLEREGKDGCLGLGEKSMEKGEKHDTALLTNLLEDGHYTSGQVESAKNEAKAGLTRKHVGHFLKLRLATRAHHTAT